MRKFLTLILLLGLLSTFVFSETNNKTTSQEVLIKKLITNLKSKKANLVEEVEKSNDQNFKNEILTKIESLDELMVKLESLKISKNIIEDLDNFISSSQKKIDIYNFMTQSITEVNSEIDEWKNAPPAPVTNITISDKDNDNGDELIINWNKSIDDASGKNNVFEYIILRAEGNPNGEFKKVLTVSSGVTQVNDKEGVKPGVKYFYKIKTMTDIEEKFSVSEISEAGVAYRQWFNKELIDVFVWALIIAGFILYNIRRAKLGEELFIRPIGGLNAVEEAIGRATEMGRPVLYISGISDVEDIQTIASLAILTKVAKKTAEYDIPLLMPCCRSVVMTTAREIVKEAYLEAGHPDAYRADNIQYLTDHQFGFVAGVDGIMVREKPAAIFLLGTFYAESLILAETGNHVGAIQIAGTAMPSQLPFFVVACDYTLIGEELYAASAYLARQPLVLGSLKGQDWAKAVWMGFIVVGILVEIFVPQLSLLKLFTSVK